MGLFFNNTEIKGLHFGNTEITDLWFGSTNVYTVWETYEGTLPATFNANGDDMRQYQIYGNTGGVGDDSGTAYGYEIDIAVEKPIIYGFHINPNISSSYDAVTYLEDAVGKTPAAMGSTAFSYGDWQNAFFMPRPCMLKFDGTVDYYLDPNDYSQKADGTPSDYNNLSYGGNAMMEFPLIWYKFVPGAESGEGYFYCSNRKIDDTYKCFSNMDCDGNIINRFYMPIYNGCTYDGKMRSISGLQLSPWSTTAYSASATYAVGDKVNYDGKMWKCITAVETAEAFDPAKWEQFAFNGNTSGQEEITQATANNTTDKVEWYIDQWCDRVLINGLLVLIGKSLDTQSVFGRGIDGGSQAAKEAYVTGLLNDKGLFYGLTANGNTAVKVFGMENWWSLVWRRTAGLIGGANNTYLYKMTASTADGSTASAYTTNGSGYLSVGNKPTTNNHVKKMQFGLFGFLPIEVGLYSEQYYKDYYYNGTGFTLAGGGSPYGASCGAFCTRLSYDVSYRNWNIGAVPSCKPCATGAYDDKYDFAGTTTPIYIGAEPLEKDEYVDYKAGKIYRKVNNVLTPTDPPVALPALPTCEGTTIVDYADTKTETTKNILPSAQAQTLTVNGNTCTCDGQGRYHVDMNNNTDTDFVFNIPDFTIPVSVGQGGSGTWSMFNTASQSMQVKLYYNDTEIDYWSVNAANRTSDSYSSMGGETINKIIINAWNASVDGDFAFMFTNDGVLPSEFVPHEIAKPTPEKVVLTYHK